MNYWNIVRQVVEDADIVIEVADARFPEQSRNHDLEQLVKAKGKKLLIVLNKSDLIGKNEAKREMEKIKERSIFVSAKLRNGARKIKEEIGRFNVKGEVKIAVTGYPNTGKSSIINMLKGTSSARTSSLAGFTKGKQMIRISSKIMLIDTPGIIPLKEHDVTLMALLSAKSVQQIKDLEGTGMDIAEILMESNKSGLEKFYGIKASDGEEFLEELALKRKKLLKKGKPDLNASARILIVDFQKGKIGL
ncbi:50S ribosome-binding GTPase [archaeon]|nr:50S ribosome-binding GTPase [archaeon]